MSKQETSKFEVRLPLLFAVTLAAGMFIGLQLPRYGRDLRYVPEGSAHGRSAGTLEEVLRYIGARYVDSVETEKLKAGAINHLLEQLDPHSVYIAPTEMQQVQEDMSGNFEGIGIEFIIVSDTIQVVTPLAGGPSAAAGIAAGDKIITIGDSVVAKVGIDNPGIFKLLRGPKGSRVRLGILRGTETTLRQFELARDIIPMKSVDVAYLLDPKTGYIKVNRFSAKTYNEFMEALRPLAEDKNMQDLVLDLRGNPGGYLNEATDMLSQFFSEGKLLVYTEGRAEERREYKSNGRARFNLRNIAVLIDEGSASASEIMAGAVQDHDRGWVIGRRSYGKGLVQEQYDLEDGGGLRLTVSRYYTPSGRSIQRQYRNVKEYGNEALRRLHSGELVDSRKMKLADTTKYYTGLGRIVYAGGGIMPDVFIPLDTAFANGYYMDAQHHFSSFAARWLNQRDRTSLGKDADEFSRQFQVDDALLEQFVGYAEKLGVARNPANFAQCRFELKRQIKARIGKQLFQEEGFWRALNADDPAVNKALQMLRGGGPVAVRQ